MSIFWRGHNKFQSIEAIGPTSGFGDFMMPFGQSRSYGKKVYFVDPTNGSDTNNGQSWRYAFASFEAAIDAARYSHGTTDVNYDADQRAFIFLGPGNYSETTELLWSGYNITIIGCTERPGGGVGSIFNYSLDSASTAVFLISGSGNGIHNCYFKTDAAIPTIYIYNGDNNLVDSCILEGDYATNTYGIYADSMKGSVIQDCWIGGFQTAGICHASGYGIHGGILRNFIHNSTNTTYGIEEKSSGPIYNFWIDSNRIQMSGGTGVIGIYTHGSGGHPMVIDNYVSTPASTTAPISHSGGEQYCINNKTTAGTSTANPYYANG